MHGSVSKRPCNGLVLKAVLTCLVLAGSTDLRAGGREDPNRSPEVAAAGFDRLIRIAALIEKDLNTYDSSAVLLGRSSSGTERFGQEFGHAAFAMHSASGRWVVRHLYLAEKTDRATVPEISEVGFGNYLFDSGYFDEGYVFALVLPPPWGERLRAAASNDALVLTLLNPDYSAIAHPYSTKYQNCNQWALEVTAAALADESTPIANRTQAQEWLKQQGYQPTTLNINPLMKFAVRTWAAARHMTFPEDDHPPEAVAAGRYQITFPNSLAKFVQQKLPATQRLDYCYAGNTVILRKPGTPFEPGCKPGVEDRVIELED